MAKKPIDLSPGNWPQLIYRLFTSFKVATVVFVLMTLITLLGTLYQVEHGLHAAKERYFYSWIIVEKVWNIPLLVPGGMLLMWVLFINMTLGALVKVRKRWKGFGMLVGHLGMLMLLAGAFVTHKASSDGYMALYPGMKSNRVESYRDWQLEIMPLSEEGKAEKAWVLPADELQSIRSDEQRRYETADLPFDIVINGFSQNATPIPVSAPMASEANGKEIDGFKLSQQQTSKNAEQNLPGCYIELRPENGDPIETILWAGSFRFDPREKPMPFTFEVEGQKYGALLAKKTWVVPFEVELNEFIFERHPGISTARNYESRITRFEEGQPEKPVEIKMNEPMRYQGYTFFQESFGPQGSEPGDEMFSQFAVANNPADQWPLWSLVVTGIGMTLHFLIMLISFVVRSFTRPSKTTAS
ncbi:MAG: cytochrome c biogenesis protein ResB [Verrucomicrobiales bacterium]|nr:cytochrome c biogenesis protein ResB [Verrucomicrobiales bacterium]